MMETFGSGVAWIDIDNDGFQDLFFVNGAAGASNILYRNNRNGTFSNVTAPRDWPAAARAYKTGVAVGRLRQRRPARSLRHRNWSRTSSIATSGTGSSRTSPPRLASPAAQRVEHQRRVLRLRPRRRPRSLRRQLRRLPDGREPVVRRPEARLPDVLQSHHLRRHRQPPVPQQRQRHVHRRLEARRDRESRGQGARRGVLRLRPRRRSATSTWPTTWCATSSTATTATGRSRTSPTRRASASTSTASRRREWASTAAT